MRNYFNSMKKIKFSLFFLLSVFGLCAQSPILVLESENADSIHSPARVKSGDCKSKQLSRGRMYR